MDQRKEAILKFIVEQYVQTAEPIGSKQLSQSNGLSVSPATIRNDMALLEAADYIRQPHTSAGRVPTEKAYLYYLQNFARAPKPKRAAETMRSAVTQAEDTDAAVKSLARALSDLSGETAIVAYGHRRSFYTGVSNLFQKPDFCELSVMQSLSEVVDRFDEVMMEIFESISDEPQVMIGSENPFGEQVSAVMVRYSLPGGRTGILGLVGPMRMDYGRNIALIEQAKKAIDDV